MLPAVARRVVFAYKPADDYTEIPATNASVASMARVGVETGAEFIAGNRALMSKFATKDYYGCVNGTDCPAYVTLTWSLPLLNPLDDNKCRATVEAGYRLHDLIWSPAAVGPFVVRPLMLECDNKVVQFGSGPYTYGVAVTGLDWVSDSFSTVLQPHQAVYLHLGCTTCNGDAEAVLDTSNAPVTLHVEVVPM